MSPASLCLPHEKYRGTKTPPIWRTARHSHPRPGSHSEYLPPSSTGQLLWVLGAEQSLMASRDIPRDRQCSSSPPCSWLSKEAGWVQHPRVRKAWRLQSVPSVPSTGRCLSLVSYHRVCSSRLYKTLSSVLLLVRCWWGDG